MTQEELIAFLKENLSLVAEHYYPSYGSSGSIEVQLVLGDKVISSISLENCRCGSG